MGPPSTRPSSVMRRYLTPSVHSMAFVDIDKNPATKSQNAAPAPPILIAMATPPILPTPTVPDTAVASARKWLISPFAFGSAKSPRTCLTANQKPRILTKPRYTVKKRAPAASHATTRGTLTPKRLTEKNTTFDNAAANGDKKLSIAAASASMYESLFFMWLVLIGVYRYLIKLDEQKLKLAIYFCARISLAAPKAMPTGIQKTSPVSTYITAPNTSPSPSESPCGRFAFLSSIPDVDSCFVICLYFQSAVTLRCSPIGVKFLH